MTNEKVDLYKQMAAKIFNIHIDNVTISQRNKIKYGYHMHLYNTMENRK